MAKTSKRRKLISLSGKNLACERGGRLVFSHLDFCISDGQLLVLRGPNGAGKSSLLRIVAGLTMLAGGKLEIAGGDGELTIGQQCHLIAHHNALKPALSVYENLIFWARFLGGGDVSSALHHMALDELADFPAALLSAGQKRRLALARLALVPRPVWLLDEPTVGLDTASLARLSELASTHLDQGGLIIAATHVDLGMPVTVTCNFTHDYSKASE